MDMYQLYLNICMDAKVNLSDARLKDKANQNHMITNSQPSDPLYYLDHTSPSGAVP